LTHAFGAPMHGSYRALNIYCGLTFEPGPLGQTFTSDVMIVLHQLFPKLDPIPTLSHAHLMALQLDPARLQAVTISDRAASRVGPVVALSLLFLTV
jgi:hypothetical protein